ncbi:hypothetical protein Acr_00g0099690 [Actinidia rufa]|uniref:Uncharacterized protein n=1 Tax=Actinidia rufa TaxID=165716 RepID=A0A7J0DZK7_9ERIC|nr:hypothetical protein Acr_00g0099690 [Actinidia rufa]
MGTIKKGKTLGIEEELKEEGINEGEREKERMDVDVEEDRALVSIEEKTDTGYETDPVNLEQEQNMGYRTDTLNDDVHRGFTMGMTYPTHRANPTQEGPPTQENPSHQVGPPAWFFEYFEKFDQSLGKIKHQQAKIIHNQNCQQEHIGRLESAFYGIREDVYRVRNLFVEQGSKIDKVGNTCETMQSMQEDHLQQLSDIRDNLGGIWNTIDPPPPILFDPYNVPPSSQPYYRHPPY